jgi:hypothetical protein
MCDPFSHHKVRRECRQSREQLHPAHLCDAWNGEPPLFHTYSAMTQKAGAPAQAVAFVEGAQRSPARQKTKMHGAEHILQSLGMRGTSSSDLLQGDLLSLFGFGSDR